ALRERASGSPHPSLEHRTMMKLSTFAIASLFAVGCAGPSAVSTRASLDHQAETAGCTSDTPWSTLAAAQMTSGHLYGIRQVRERQFLARAVQPTRTTGADLLFHASPQVTGEYLERVFQCHAAVGRAADPEDPFHLASRRVPTAELRSLGHGYAGRIRGHDARSGRD